MESVDRDLRAVTHRKLDEWVEKVKARGVEVEGHVSPRSPGMTIAVTAEAIEADLIVMGTRGLTGLQHVLLGSVAERTICVVAGPVLTVMAATG